MAAAWRQVPSAGGHLLVCEAGVADGHVRIEETWQHITAEPELPGGDPVVVGSTCTLRTAWLNGARVLDPGLAARLLAEVLRES